MQINENIVDLSSVELVQHSVSEEAEASWKDKIDQSCIHALEVFSLREHKRFRGCIANMVAHGWRVVACHIEHGVVYGSKTYSHNLETEYKFCSSKGSHGVSFSESRPWNELQALYDEAHPNR